MDLSSLGSDLIQPFGRAQNYLLQVLVTRFHLSRQGQSGGVTLRIHFDRNTPSIWNRQAKDEIRAHIPDFLKRAPEYQKKLDESLLRGSGDLHPFDPFDDPSFPFRYVSGGTLPILNIGRRQYYCLFYREVYPIGWNIANGAADSFHELLDPFDAAKRELGEELLIVNPARKTRCVFEWDTSELVDWPGFGVARRLFQRQFPDLNLGACQELRTKPNWLDAPDSLWVSFEREEPRLITDCFVNVNATDFGIEIDRVAKITVDEEAVVFDGEITNDVPVGAPIGLFPVEQVNETVDRANRRSAETDVPAHQLTTVFPTKFFYDARPYDNVGERMSDLVREVYIPRLRKTGILSEGEQELWDKTKAEGHAYILCPATHAIISRLIRAQSKTSPRAPKNPRFDFFLSYAAPDEKYAESVFHRLTSGEMGLSVFFNKKTPMLTQFADEIRRAVHDSDGMIVIATKPEYMKREGVLYEWITFLNAMADHRKPRTAPVISFVSGFGYDELPGHLSLHQMIHFEQADRDPGLRDLVDFIRRVQERKSSLR